METKGLDSIHARTVFMSLGKKLSCWGLCFLSTVWNCGFSLLWKVECASSRSWALPRKNLANS